MKDDGPFVLPDNQLTAGDQICRLHTDGRAGWSEQKTEPAQPDRSINQRLEYQRGDMVHMQLQTNMRAVRAQEPLSGQPDFSSQVHHSRIPKQGWVR